MQRHRSARSLSTVRIRRNASAAATASASIGAPAYSRIGASMPAWRSAIASARSISDSASAPPASAALRHRQRAEAVAVGLQRGEDLHMRPDATAQRGDAARHRIAVDLQVIRPAMSGHLSSTASARELALTQQMEHRIRRARMHESSLRSRAIPGAYCDPCVYIGWFYPAFPAIGCVVASPECLRMAIERFPMPCPACSIRCRTFSLPIAGAVAAARACS